MEERGHDAPDRAEHNAQEHDADAQSEERVVEQDPVPSIGWQVPRVARHLLGIVRHLAVERHVRELHADPAEQYGGVGIALDVGEGVVLAVDGDPLARPDADTHPDHEAEEPGQAGSHRHRTMSEGPVEVDRGGQVGQHRDQEADREREEEVDPHGARILVWPTDRSVGSRLGLRLRCF